MNNEDLELEILMYKEIIKWELFNNQLLQYLISTKTSRKEFNEIYDNCYKKCEKFVEEIGIKKEGKKNDKNN